MHNKSLTADSEATIVGGRNVGDGSSVPGSGMLFGTRCCSPSVPLRARWRKRSSNTRTTHRRIAPIPSSGNPHRTPCQRCSRDLQQCAHLPKPSSTWRRCAPLSRRCAPFAPVAARVGSKTLDCDPPEKQGAKHRTPSSFREDLRSTRSRRTRDRSRLSMDFVPGRKGTKRSRASPRVAGIGLRILTNSLSATDVGLVDADTRGTADRRPQPREDLRAKGRLRRELRNRTRCRKWPSYGQLFCKPPCEDLLGRSLGVYCGLAESRSARGRSA